MTVGVGIVGGGNWARFIHIPALTRLPGYQLIGVTASTPERAQKIATDFNLPKGYEDNRELINDPAVQVVDILTPNYLHRPIALAALRAGKDVIIIKPIAMGLAEAGEIVDTAERLGRKIYYAENVPFIPAIVAFKALVDQGLYGKVFRLKSMHGTGGPHSAWFSDPKKSGGGCIMDMGVHGLSFLQFFAGGAEPLSVYAEAGAFVHDYPVEDTSVMIVKYDDGKLAQTEDSWSVPGGFDSRYEVFGTLGHGFVDLLYGHPIRSVLGGNLEGGSNAVQFHAVDDHVVKDGHLAMMSHFLDCIEHDAPCRSNGEDGYKIMRLVDAAYGSLRAGKRVALR